jgi:hypothetical protein
MLNMMLFPFTLHNLHKHSGSSTQRTSTESTVKVSAHVMAALLRAIHESVVHQMTPRVHILSQNEAFWQTSCAQGRGPDRARQRRRSITLFNPGGTFEIDAARMTTVQCDPCACWHSEEKVNATRPFINDIRTSPSSFQPHFQPFAP